MTKTSIAAFIAFSVSIAAGRNLEIACRETGNAHAIVVAPSSEPSVRYAAEELRDHVCLMTGVKMRIVSALDENPGKSVFIRCDKQVAGDDGFRLKVEGDDLHIIGGGRGHRLEPRGRVPRRARRGGGCLAFHRL